MQQYLYKRKKIFIKNINNLKILQPFYIWKKKSVTATVSLTHSHPSRFSLQRIVWNKWITSSRLAQEIGGSRKPAKNKHFIWPKQTRLETRESWKWFCMIASVLIYRKIFTTRACLVGGQISWMSCSSIKFSLLFYLQPNTP